MSKKTVTIETSISGLFTSIRGFKYSFYQAVADIVDNCIDAHAGKVDIIIEKGNHVLIIDDGDGMDIDELTSAITPWGNAGEKLKKDKHKKGKYGIGLKSAGFSLGDEIIVHTKKKNKPFLNSRLNLDELKKNKGNKLEIYSGKETEVWKQFGGKKGTIVEIIKINDKKITNDAIDGLANRLGVSFYGLLDAKELKIEINKKPISGLNPLLPGMKKNSRNNYYQSFKSKSITLKNEEGKEAIFKMSAAYIGRSHFWSEKEKKEYRWWLGKNKGTVKIDDQGLYIMRNGRLITHGGWQKTRAFSHHHSPVRVLIDYSTEGDSLMGVDHTKTKPELEKHFIDIINSRYIDKIFYEAEELFRQEGNSVIQERQVLKADIELKTKSLVKPTSVDSMIDKDDKRKKYYPEYEEEQEDLAKEISEELEDEWIKFVEKLPHDAMWKPELNKNGDVTCVFSDTHPGYGALYFEDDEDKVRKNLNMLFLTMSAYELEFSNLTKKLSPKLKEELQKQFKAFRVYVSKHFRDFD